MNSKHVGQGFKVGQASSPDIIMTSGDACPTETKQANLKVRPTENMKRKM